MTVARGLAVGALAIAVAIVLALLLLSTGKTYSYKVVFQNAGQLVKGDDVQVGGRRVGNVDSITLTAHNNAEIHITMNGSPAPLHDGTTATIRATSLSGIANRYVALTPGPNSNHKLKANSTLGLDKTTSIVDLDQLFDTLDKPTLHGLQRVVQGSAEQYRGVAKQANRAAHYFNPVLSTTARLVNEVNRDTPTFEQFVIQTSKVMTALSERAPTLTALVSNTNTTTGAIADANDSLDADLRKLPLFLRRANTTFVNLRATLDDLDVLVDASKPATKRLAPLLVQLRPLVHRAVPTIADLRQTISAPGPENDLIDLNHKTPELAQQAKIVFPRGVKALKQSQSVLEFVRPYVPELTGWFRDFGQGAAAYDANGHYARIMPIFNAFSLTGNPAAPLLQPTLAGDRLNALKTLNGGTDSIAQLNRCPGAATQARPDGGNPFTDNNPDLDCDPSERLPGEFSP